MAIDTSMYGRIQPVQIESPLNAMAQISQLQGAQQRNRLAELALGTQQREVEQEKALSQLYKDSIGADGKFDRQKLLTGAAQNGLGAKIPTLQKTFSEQDKATADLEKTRWDATSKKLEIAGQAFGYVRNNPTPEAANSVLDYLGQNGVYDADTVAKYKQIVAADPTQIKALADQAFQSVLGAKEQLSSFQTRNTGGTTDTLEINPVTGATKVVNSVKNTQSPDSVASVAATIRGQNLTDARGREANQLKAKEIEMGGKPPPGYRWNGPNLEAIPGGPGDKLPESQQKQVVGVNNLSNAINEYRAELANWSKTGAINADARAKMGTKYNNMMLQAKEAYNLGVLNGPDLEILTSVITDPRSFKGVLTSKDALDTQASELDRIMQGVAGVSSQSRQPQQKQKSAPSQSSGGGLTPEEQKELEQLRKQLGKR